MRCLAPAGGFPDPLKVYEACKRPGLVALAEQGLKEIFKADTISLCSNGKEGIEILCQHLASRGFKKLVTGAYSCPDIVAAATRGGLKVRLTEVNSITLETVFSDLDEKTEVILLSNLYGLVDDIQGLNKFQIIDDACQAALSFDGETRVGARSIGVISFGRGKAVCGVGGGAIIGHKQSHKVSPEKLESLVKLFVYGILENPALYGIPASLPFLKLGETVFEPNYADSSLSIGKISTAYSALQNFENETALRIRNQELWVEHLKNLNVRLPIFERKSPSAKPALTRFPVLIQDNRDKVYSELAKAGAGASLSYPSTLDVLCKGSVEGSGFKEASKIALQIITLPTHRYVTEADMIRSSEIIKKYA
jgi:perosamine synthetase